LIFLECSTIVYRSFNVMLKTLPKLTPGSSLSQDDSNIENYSIRSHPSHSKYPLQTHHPARPHHFAEDPSSSTTAPASTSCDYIRQGRITITRLNTRTNYLSRWNLAIPNVARLNAKEHASYQEPCDGMLGKINMPAARN
jgi:hypothetical protein